VTEQELAVEEMLAILLRPQPDGDAVIEILANVCFGLFVRAGWQTLWPAFAYQVWHGIEQSALMDGPAGHA
jgi:hypothetical protein